MKYSSQHTILHYCKNRMQQYATKCAIFRSGVIFFLRGGAANPHPSIIAFGASILVPSALDRPIPPSTTSQICHEPLDLHSGEGSGKAAQQCSGLRPRSYLRQDRYQTGLCLGLKIIFLVLIAALLCMTRRCDTETLKCNKHLSSFVQ